MGSDRPSRHQPALRTGPLLTSSAWLSTLLLGGGFNRLPNDVPSELSGAMLLDLWTRALPDIATCILRLSRVRMDVLRQKGLAPSHSLSNGPTPSRVGFTFLGERRDTT